MDGKDKYVFDFGQWRLDPDERLLLNEREPVLLAPKAFAILTILLERSGDLVSKEELLELVWKDSFVEEANIQVHVSAIRKALRGSGGSAFIETIPKRGYRFKGTVTKNYIRPETADHEPPQFATPAISAGIGNVSSRSVIPAGNTFTVLKSKAVVAAAALLIIGFAGAAYSLLSEKGMLREFIRPAKRFSFSAVKIEKLTDSGGAFNADISSDGKYVAYETVIGDKYSVWLMEPGTNSNVQVVAPSESRHGGLTFSPNREHLYFTVSDNGLNPAATLFRI